ncbi:unnamed protein product [Amoebophrya sp. A25]|nr:unnamed protein product [Amoebophrya sp. A25]|eukprot:GSA25T00016535001.1
MTKSMTDPDPPSCASSLFDEDTVNNAVEEPRSGRTSGADAGEQASKRGGGQLLQEAQGCRYVFEDEKIARAQSEISVSATSTAAATSADGKKACHCDTVEEHQEHQSTSGTFLPASSPDELSANTASSASLLKNGSISTLPSTSPHSASTFSFTLATLNCYLIPEKLVTRPNASCRDQGQRAAKIGRFLQRTSLSGLQEVWGSQCRTMELGAVDCQSEYYSHSREGNNAPDETKYVNDSPASRQSADLRFFYQSLGFTVLDTLKLNAIQKTGGLQLVHDSERLEMLAYGKRTFSTSISKSKKGMLCALFRCKPSMTDHGENEDAKHKYVLLLNLHLDHANVRDSQRKQLHEVQGYLRDIAEAIFSKRGGETKSSTCSTTNTFTMSGSCKATAATSFQKSCPLKYLSGRDDVLPLDAGCVAAFVTGDFNIDGGSALEGVKERDERLLQFNLSEAAKIRKRNNRRARGRRDGQDDADNNVDKDTSVEGASTRWSCRRRNSSYATSPGDERRTGTAAQEELGQARDDADGSDVEASSNVINQSSRVSSEQSLAMLEYLMKAPASEQRDLYQAMIEALGGKENVMDLAKEYNGGRETYSSEANPLAMYQTRRLDYLFALRTLPGATSSTPSRSIKSTLHPLLTPTCTSVEVVCSDVLSDHWPVKAHITI